MEDFCKKNLINSEHPTFQGLAVVARGAAARGAGLQGENEQEPRCRTWGRMAGRRNFAAHPCKFGNFHVSLPLLLFCGCTLLLQKVQLHARREK
jgi:hypothetical protein